MELVLDVPQGKAVLFRKKVRTLYLIAQLRGMAISLLFIILFFRDLQVIPSSIGAPLAQCFMLRVCVHVCMCAMCSRSACCWCILLWLCCAEWQDVFCAVTCTFFFTAVTMFCEVHTGVTVDSDCMPCFSMLVHNCV